MSEYLVTEYDIYQICRKYIIVSMFAIAVLFNMLGFNLVFADDIALSQKKDNSNVFTLGQIEVTAEYEVVEDITTDIVDNEQMRLFNRDNVADALNLTTGVTLSRAGARNEQMVFVRGFDVKHAPLFLDGIPIYVMYDGYPDLGRFTTFDLSQIVVSKGFSSVLYGPNTMGGAINIMSRKPDAEFEGNVGVGIASGNTTKAYGNFGSNQGRWYVQGGFSSVDQDYFEMSDDLTSTKNENGGDRENSYYKDQKINFKVGYTPSALDEYALSYIKQDGEKGTPPYTGKDPSARVRFWQWPYWDKESIYFNSKTSINQQNYLKTRLYYDKYKNSLWSYDDASYTTMKKGSSFKSCYNDYTVGGSVEAGTEYFSGHLIKSSFHYKKDAHNEVGTESSPELNFRDQIFSLGLEDTVTINEKLSFIAGVSYDWQSPLNADDYSSNTGIISDFPTESANAFNPQLSGFYKVSDTGTVHAAVAGKSRLPTMKDRYSYRLGYGIPNPELDEETSVNYEIGYQDSLSERIFVKTALFYSDINDYIMLVNVPDPKDAAKSVTQNHNLGKVNIYGAEAEISASIMDNLEYGLGYTYTDWENKSSNEKLINIPMHKIFTYLKYNPLEKLSLLADFEYNAKRFSNSNGLIEAGSYTLASLKSDYEIYKGITLEVGVNNLFDKNYEIDEGYPEPGRTYFTNMTYKF